MGVHSEKEWKRRGGPESGPPYGAQAGWAACGVRMGGWAGVQPSNSAGGEGGGGAAGMT